MTESDITPVSLPDPIRQRRRRFWVWLVCACLVIACASGIFFWRAFQPDLNAVVELGWQAYQENNLNTIQRQMVIAERLEKKSDAARFLRGAFLIASREPELALVPLRDASKNPQLRHRALLLAARAYLDLHQFLSAEQLLTDCLNEEPDDIEAHRLFGAMYYDIGANPLAIEHLEAVARLAPTDARPLRLIGLMRKDFQDYTAAVAAYREAASRLTEGSLAGEVRVELAECLTEMREYQEALAVLKVDDQTPEAVAVRLLCFRALGRMDEAKLQVEQANQFTEHSLSLTLELGNYFDAVGDLKQAAAYFERAVKKAPLDFIPRYKLSTVYARLGRKEDAAEELRQMQKNRQSYDRLHALQNQAMREPYNATVRYDMGVAALALNRTEMARLWFDAALGLDPGNQAARAALQTLDNLRRSSLP